MIKKPMYDDDHLTPEEERALMAIPVPGPRAAPPMAPPPPPMMPQPQFTMNDLVRKKLMAQMQGNRGVDSPYDEYNKASIESGALSGIAGGMAQLGTVHGKTPDPSPYIKASQRMLDPLKQSAMQLEKERSIDPRVIAYLQKSQPKVAATGPQYKPLSAPLQGNVQGFYNAQNPSDIITGPKLYDKPTQPKSPSKEVNAASAAEAHYVEKSNLFNDLMKQYENAGLFTGPIGGNIGNIINAAGFSVNADFDALNQNIMSMTNQYIKEITGASASAQEMKRLQGNLPRPGQSKALFESKVRGLEKEAQAIVNEKRMAAGFAPIDFTRPVGPQIKNKTSPLQNLQQIPGQNPQAPVGNKPPLTPAELKELQELEALEAAQGGKK